MSPYGFDVFLSSNANGVAGGYQEDQSFGATPAGISAGLLTNSTGSTDFVLLSSPTFGTGPNYTGAANVATAYVSPIVINELMYDPSEPTAAETAAGLQRRRRFRVHRALQPFGDAAIAGQLLSRQRSRLHVRLVCRRRSRRILDTGKRSNCHVDNRRSRRPEPTPSMPTTASPIKTATRETSIATAQYTINYPGGSQTVTIDQSTAVNGKLDLGSVTTTGARPDSASN